MGRKDTVMLKEPRLNYVLEHSKPEDRGNYSNLRIQKMMEDSIHAMANLLEKRDAYTSCHQKRVARLATAIATEMHFSTDRILGLNLASSIHDVGKMVIPFEILSKPGKLNAIEFNIVKEHPKVAHDILVNMEFYWPVSQMVVQHHERLDGSGYPAGLKGDAILPEARVLAIADVMEAMSFDRPYRAALGIDMALEEINTKKGILFDVDAVDASLKLFREKGYRLG
jgi:HD-GYP domain-containing protein (c-di-GMP phosphodiesterase class II)